MPPVTVMIKPVSGACNMRCHYCFYADEMRNRSTAVYPAMDEETLEAVVRRTMAYADVQATFTFQGGEPTLAGIAFYEHLLKLQKKYNPRGIVVNNAIQTNGLDLSDSMIELFAKNHFLVGVSLDGNQQTHDLFRKDAAGNGTYHTIRRNIKRLEAAGVDFNILCVVNQAVAEHTDEVLQSFAEYPFLQFIPCMDDMDGKQGVHSLSNEAYAYFLKKSFDVYEQSHREGKRLSIRQFDNWIAMLLGMPPESCAMRGQCTCGFLIESNGDVYPCDFYALDEWRLGNVKEHSFRQMLRNPLAHSFCNASLPIPDDCQQCRWYNLCRNGCRRERDPQTGLYRLCSGTRSFLDECGERMIRMAEKFK